jgi:hypothetical protein
VAVICGKATPLNSCLGLVFVKGGLASVKNVSVTTQAGLIKIVSVTDAVIPTVASLPDQKQAGDQQQPIAPIKNATEAVVELYISILGPLPNAEVVSKSGSNWGYSIFGIAFVIGLCLFAAYTNQGQYLMGHVVKQRISSGYRVLGRSAPLFKKKSVQERLL